ncbi:MAG TPA: hypothetical protein H9887_04345 [Candidatus Dorea intestinavium]|nr:hypothetical protein [Candidatus Dorea intestinavium]
MVKKIMNNKKARIVLIASLMIILAGVSFTLAYLTDRDQTVKNDFTIGEITTTIEEPPIEIKDGVIHKAPSIKNLGPNEALIRARITITPQAIATVASLDIKPGWVLNSTDGFYYYTKIVKVGDSIPLFTEVSGIVDEDNKLVEGIENLDDFDISIYQEAIQTIIWSEDETGEIIKVELDNDGETVTNYMTLWNQYR